MGIIRVAVSFLNTVVFRQVITGPKQRGLSPFVIPVFKDEALITLYFIRHLGDVTALLVNPGLVCMESISVLSKDLRQFTDVIPVLRDFSRHFRIGNYSCLELISFLPDLKGALPEAISNFTEAISNSTEAISNSTEAISNLQEVIVIFPEVISISTEAFSGSPEAFRM